MAKLKECIGIVLFTIFIEVVLLDELNESENIRVSIKKIANSFFIKGRIIRALKILFSKTYFRKPKVKAQQIKLFCLRNLKRNVHNKRIPHRNAGIP